MTCKFPEIPKWDIIYLVLETKETAFNFTLGF